MSPSARVEMSEVTILGYLERGALTAATQFARLQNLAIQVVVWLHAITTDGAVDRLEHACAFLDGVDSVVK